MPHPSDYLDILQKNGQYAMHFGQNASSWAFSIRVIPGNQCIERGIFFAYLVISGAVPGYQGIE
jgi:hypothetical protein